MRHRSTPGKGQTIGMWAACIRREGGRGQRRRTGKTPAVCLSALLLTGCTAGGNHALSPRGTLPARTSPTSTPAPPAASTPVTAPLSAQVILPSKRMVAGSTMTAHVIVDNRSGQALKVGGCGSLFQVLLTSAHVHPQPAWPSCIEPISVPVGVSKYTVSVMASYSMCDQRGPPPVCRKAGQPPPLPPGQYEATLFQIRSIAPPPPPPTIWVTQ